MGDGVLRRRVRVGFERDARGRVDEAVVLRPAEQVLAQRALLAARHRGGALEDAADDAARAAVLGRGGALRAEAAHLRAQTLAHVHGAELVVAHVRVGRRRRLRRAQAARVGDVVAVVVLARAQHRQVARRRRVSGHEPVHGAEC